jgi:5-methylcytosine-specific restriction endonuclease McrA
MTYADKLKSPQWQKKRLEVLERAGWLCQLCGDSTTQLHVHHPKYVPNCEPWEYENLISLCATCHGAHHAARIPDVDPFWFMVQRDANLGDPQAIQLLAMREAGTVTAA